MLKPRRALRGISVIELMVVVTVIGVMVMLAMPGIGNWISNSRVRSVGEELQNALRLAQSEAVNRSRTVAFVRTNAAPARNAAPAAAGRNWYVQVLPIDATEGALTAFQNASFVQGGTFTAQSNADVSGQEVVCFNAMGRVVSATTGLSADCVAPSPPGNRWDYDITLAGRSDRPLRVQLFLGGRVRMCDPNAATGQPQVCTP